MRRRLGVTDTTDYFGEFLEEHPGLWPERPRQGDAVDPFTEFDTEIEPVDDRWLRVARGRQRRPPRIHDHRHMLAVASVVVSLFTPAGVISTVIVGRELTLSSNELPPPPARLVAASVDRLIGLPTMKRLPSLPRRPVESNAALVPPSLPRDRNQPGPRPQTNASPAPMDVLPLTTALLSASISPAVPLDTSPPARSTPPQAIGNVPAASLPMPVASPPPPAATFMGSTAPSPPTRTPASTRSDPAAVRAALDRYREAFSNLDAGSAKSVWPAVDEKTLARAFSQVSRQEFVFEACSVDVSGPRATASCRGRAQYVPKVGGRNARVEPRHWTFTLRRAETEWTIESVDSR